MPSSLLHPITRWKGKRELLSRRFDFELYLFELCLNNNACCLFWRFDFELNTTPLDFKDGRRLVNKIALQQGLEPVERQPIQTLIDLRLLLLLVGLHVGENAFHH